MAREGIPITPELLRWARERAGFSLQELIPEFRGIATWESGAAFPTYPQLERLSEKLKVPIAVFFFPEPPDEPPIRESFRGVPSVQFDALPRRIRFLLRKAAALQTNLAELNDGRNTAERFILNDLRFSRSMDVRRMALRVRDYLAVPLEEQMAWPDSEHAFARWRDVLEQHGVAVFKDAFLDDDYAGFCLYDAVFPLIYVNNSVRTREIFTLFHELGHLLFRTSGIDVLGDDPPVAGPASGRAIEATCNQFAAEFLLPEERFAADASKSAPTDDRVEALAERYSVSRESVLRRFLDRGGGHRRGVPSPCTTMGGSTAGRRWREPLLDEDRPFGDRLHQPGVLALSPEPHHRSGACRLLGHEGKAPLQAGGLFRAEGRLTCTSSTPPPCPACSSISIAGAFRRYGSSSTAWWRMAA